MKKRSSLRSSRALYLAAFLLIGGVVASPGSAQPDSPKLEPFAHVKGAEKVSLSLLEAAEAAKSGKSLADGLGAKAVTHGNGIKVEIASDNVDDALLAAIAKAGATVLHSSPRSGRVTVVLDSADAVASLAALHGVKRIDPAGRAMKAQHKGIGDSFGGGGVGSAKGQGDRALRADLLSVAQDTRGVGSRVGILSDSFASRLSNPSLYPPGGSQAASTAALTFGPTAGKPELLTLPAGIYTAVVRSAEAGKVRIFFDSSVTVEEAPTSSDFPCNLAFPLNRAAGGADYTTRVLDSPTDTSFAAPSCGTGENYVLLTFTLATDAANFSIRATPETPQEVSVTLRRGCSNSAASEIACASNTSTDNRRVSGLRNQNSGDLPEFVTVLRDYEGSFVDEVSNEGAAMAELIHDIAPAAEIGFHTAWESEAGFADGIRALANFIFSPNATPFFANVIVDDVIYFREPLFQPGIVEQAISDVVAGGVTYFSAAGNSANYGYRFTFQDVSGANDDGAVPNGNDLARWPGGDGYLPITVDPGASFQAHIQWNQPWESLPGSVGAEIDFDAYIVPSKGQGGFQAALFSDKTERVSREVQGDTGRPLGNPYEVVSYINDTDTRQTVYLALNHYRGRKDRLPQTNQPIELAVLFTDYEEGKVFINNIDPANASTGGPTIWGHIASPEVIAVGAINWVDTPTFDTNFGPSSAIDPERFTSRGGTYTRYFDASGFPLPVPMASAKPDIAAVDGNNTTFFPGFEDGDRSKPLNNFDADEFPNFFGTSAAAPNAAAVAALLLSLNPTLRAADIKTILARTAVDVTGVGASPGFDNLTGAGLIDAFEAGNLLVREYGRTSGQPAPTSRLYTFSGGAEGWTSDSIPQFTAPGFRLGPDTLDLTLTNASNTFGWIKSPEFLVSPVGVRDSQGREYLTVRARSDAGSLLQAQVRVSNSTNNPALAPTFRIRTLSHNSERSDVLVVSSLGGGEFSPGGPATKTYRHYFPVPESSTRFRLFIDLLGFDNEGAAGATLRVDEVILIGFPSGTNTLTGSFREGIRTFNQNGPGAWTARNADPLGRVHADGSNGLRLGPASNTGVTSFGFWGSPESAPLATFRRDRLYQFTFTAKSDVPTALKTTLPAFRFRVNTGNNQLSAYADINATTPTASVPTASESLSYKLFLVAPEELVGQPLNTAFDYLYVHGIGKDGNQAVTLQQVIVDSYQRPLEDALVP